MQKIAVAHQLHTTSTWYISQIPHNMMQTLSKAISMDHVTIGSFAESPEVSLQLLKLSRMQLSLLQSHTETTKKETSVYEGQWIMKLRMNLDNVIFANE